jgi:hypothetical protein
MPLLAPTVLLRGVDCLLVGHVAVGNGVGGLIQRREDDPELSYTATVLGGEPVHGGNAAGLVCAALDLPGHPLVASLLEGADSAGEAAAMLEALPVQARRTVTLLLAAATTALRAAVGERGVAVEPAEPGGGEATGNADLPALLAALRAAEPPPHPGSTPAAALAAVLSRRRPPALYIALGPPSCSVFIRYWPGTELVPDVAASPEGAPLARLAAAVAQTTATDPELRRAARRRLDLAEAEALREGEAAERMAALMDEHTDDRGAAVRRLVAQSHAAELARQALEELAVPAPPGSRAGPRLSSRRFHLDARQSTARPLRLLQAGGPCGRRDGPRRRRPGSLDPARRPRYAGHPRRRQDLDAPWARLGVSQLRAHRAGVGRACRPSVVRVRRGQNKPWPCSRPPSTSATPARRRRSSASSCASPSITSVLSGDCSALRIAGSSAPRSPG